MTDRLGICSRPAGAPEALAMARRLNLPLTNDTDLLLEWDATASPPRWQLRGRWPGAPKPLYVDFTQGAVAWKIRHPGKGKHPLARAIGIEHGKRPLILDATAGLGRDAWLLASLGCTVYLCERHPVVATLLLDGLERARRHPHWSALFRQSMFWLGSDLTALDHWSGNADVIYLDPMYPPPARRRTAAVKKDMQYLRRLVGHDTDAAEWLASARARVSRVVVKRPDWADPLAKPDTIIETGDHRFDVYLG